MERCRECGRGPAIGQWCSECRHRSRVQGGQAAAVLGVGTESGRAQAVPGPMWAVIGTFAGSAVLTLLVAVVQGVGFFFLLPPLLIAAGLGLLAHRLYRGSRVARALSIVAAVGLLALAMGSATNAGWVLIALACVVAAGMSALSPSARAFFSGPFGHAGSSPVSVALVRIITGVLGSLAGLIALMMLIGGLVALGSSAASSGGSAASMLVGGLFGAFGSAMLVMALPMAGVAVFWFWAMQALGSGSRGARLAVSIVAVLDLFLLLISAAGSGSVGAWLVGLVVHAAAVAALWVPSDARLHFGDVPLPAVDEWHRKAVALVPMAGTPASTSPPSGAASTAPRPFTASGSFSSAAWGAPEFNSRSQAPHPTSGPTPTPSPASTAFVAPAPRHAADGTTSDESMLEDPITAPIALGLHSRRDGQPA